MNVFGDVSFEEEQSSYKENWKEYFFTHSPFVSQALDKRAFLIVGRRGSGKSTLAQYFAYQEQYENSTCEIVEGAEVYSSNFYKLAQETGYSKISAIQRLEKIWSALFWKLIFRVIRNRNPEIHFAVKIEDNIPSAAKFMKKIIGSWIKKQVGEEGWNAVDQISTWLEEKSFEIARDQALQEAEKSPVFIVVDSREQYNAHDEHEMWITAALIQTASKFNLAFKDRGLHLKVCIADEIFPVQKQSVVSNPLKYIKDPVYLFWRPKDLVRMICWRFHKYLDEQGYPLKEKEIDWESFKDVYENFWIPYFGEEIININGIKEKTLPYVIRHTQLRPRQLILILNKIALISKRQRQFPYFDSDSIREGIRASEIDLSDGILNAYSDIYPNITRIVSVIGGFPSVFKGSELDRVAPRSASFWKQQDVQDWQTKYDKTRFRELLIELGIVGRVRGGINGKKSIVKADFEFSYPDRLAINDGDMCVIHPMFHKKLNIDTQNHVVYPFPDYSEVDRLLA